MVTEFTNEAEMIAVWLKQLDRASFNGRWTIYHETAGWDLLLVHEDGYQLGLEAKLSLNAKVIDQALVGSSEYWRNTGPDYRGVLVPQSKLQRHLENICRAIGIGIITVRQPERGMTYGINLPNEQSQHSRAWPNWMPEERCKLPDYIPDVAGGHAAPIQLTDWKIRAIKLMIVLDRRGYVTRADMRKLSISPTRWCDSWNGYLDRSVNGYVRNGRTPDLRAQHPKNYPEIEADFEIWAAGAEIVI